jgi:hypothetical protein
LRPNRPTVRTIKRSMAYVSDGSSELPSDGPSDDRPATSMSDGRPPPSDGRKNQPSDNNPLKDKGRGR